LIDERLLELKSSLEKLVQTPGLSEEEWAAADRMLALINWEISCDEFRTIHAERSTPRNTPFIPMWV
jgi:hypothetical protein